MKFVLFHGAFGSPEGNWFPQLKEKLEALGQAVIVPQFPVDSWDEVTKAGPGVPLKNQNLENWLKVFEPIFESLKKREKLCFVGHSLGCVFLLHVVEKFNIKLDCAIFVAPFMDKLGDKYWQFDHANESFYKISWNFEKLKKLIPTSYVLHSDNDPYVDRNHSIIFSKVLDSSLIFVKRAGHMNSEVNLNEFPLVFELCNTRLDLTLYQRYLAEKNKENVLDYLQVKHKKIMDLSVHLAPEEIFNEGRFKFRYLKHDGFCTFRSGEKNWNPFDVYYSECRKAAKRTKNVTRVYMVEKVNDLKRQILRTQMKADLEGGVYVMLCPFDKIKDSLQEPDFGIWDDEYICFIHYHPDKRMEEIILDGRPHTIKMVQKEKEIVQKFSIPITDVDRDLDKYIKENTTTMQQ